MAKLTCITWLEIAMRKTDGKRLYYIARLQNGMAKWPGKTFYLSFCLFPVQLVKLDSTTIFYAYAKPTYSQHKIRKLSNSTESPWNTWEISISIRQKKSSILNRTFEGLREPFYVALWSYLKWSFIIILRDSIYEEYLEANKLKFFAFD